MSIKESDKLLLKTQPLYRPLPLGHSPNHMPPCGKVAEHCTACYHMKSQKHQKYLEKKQNLCLKQALKSL